MKQSVFVLLVITITLNVAHGMSFRHRRQSGSMEQKPYDRHGSAGVSWSRPRRQSQSGVRRQSLNPGNPWPELPQPRRPQIPTQSSTPAPRITQGTTTTTQSPAVQQCIRNCPVTSEYNPVCGTDLVQYSNPGRLECARFCGANVSLLRASRCPTPTAA